MYWHSAVIVCFIIVRKSLISESIKWIHDEWWHLYLVFLFFAVHLLLLLLWLLYRRVFMLNFMNESVRARTGPSVYWKYDLPLSWIESNEIESIRAWYVIISRTHPHQWSTDWWKLRTSLRKKNIILPQL